MQALRHPNHEDIHNRLMRAYPSVPKSWYLMMLATSLSSAIILVYMSPLQLPVWGLLLAVLIALVFLIPVGIIKAVSDTGIGLNVITEFVAGLLLPGRPIANVCFKCYGYMGECCVQSRSCAVLILSCMQPCRKLLISPLT